MPSSFSRFLNDEELARVRELYERSLKEEGLEQSETASEEKQQAAVAQADDK